MVGFPDTTGPGGTAVLPAQPVVVLATRARGTDWALALSARGHFVTLCTAPEEALEASRFLGRCPVLAGDDFCDESPEVATNTVRRSDRSVPLLALIGSHNDGRTDRLVDGGADDVLLLDDEAARVSARLRSLARVPRGESSDETWGSVELDPRSRTVRLGGTTVELRPREFGVLLQLVHASGDIVPFHELQSVQWSDQADGDAAMRSCVYRLRRALDDAPGLNLEIETVRNRGYRLRELRPA